MMLLVATVPAFAQNPLWQIGGYETTSNIRAQYLNVNVPTFPQNNNLVGFFFYWIGGISGQYLFQPVIVAQNTNPNQWIGRFEIYNSNLGKDQEAYYTNFYLTPGQSASLENYLIGNGQDYQYISNGVNSGSIYMNAVSYPSTMNSEYATAESYDFTSSDFHNSGSMFFSGYSDLATTGNWYSPQLFTWRSATSGYTPPVCITSSVPSAGTSNIYYSAC